MNHRTISVILLIALVAAVWLGLDLSPDSDGPDAEPPAMAELSAQLNAAWDAGDFDAAGLAVDGILTHHREGSPTWRFIRARVYMREGRAGAAYQLLEGLTRTGHAFDLDREEFASLQDEARFQAIEARFDEVDVPLGEAVTAARVGIGDFIPEGITLFEGDFLLGSIRNGTLLRVSDQRNETILESATDGPWSIYGMGLHAATGTLWVATNSTPEFEGYDGIQRSAVLKVDVATSRIRARFELPVGGPDTRLGDVLVFGRNRVLVTESMGGGIYAVDGGSLHMISKPGAFASPQGIAHTRFGFYVADYSKGLMRFDPHSGEAEPVPGPDGISLFGIDGLVHHAGRLYAVQNGATPHRVLRLSLGEHGEITTVDVLAQALEGFDEPTLGVIDGERFCFVANSHWNRFDADGGLPSADTLEGPLVLCVPL